MSGDKILIQRIKYGPSKLDDYLKYKLNKCDNKEHDAIKHYIHQLSIDNYNMEYICEMTHVYLVDEKGINKLMIETYLMCISKSRRKIKKFNIDSTSRIDIDSNVFIVPVSDEIDEEEYNQKMNLEIEEKEKIYKFIPCDLNGKVDSDNVIKSKDKLDNNEKLLEIDLKNKNSKFKLFKPNSKVLNSISKINSDKTKTTKYVPPNIKKNIEKYSLILKNIPTCYSCRYIEKEIKRYFSMYNQFIGTKVIKDPSDNNKNKGIAFVDFSENSILNNIINNHKKLIIDNSVVSIEFKN